jgi:hypothetical protein
MDISPDKITELSALATLVIVVLTAVWRGIPALIAYLERKDAIHREDIQNLIAASREERDAFYRDLGIKLDRIHERIDKLDTALLSRQ